MKFSEQWLREWVNPPVSTEQLVEQLTMAGLEVDAVEAVAPAFAGIVVGEVLSVEPHPDADKLHVCRVAVGTSEPLQIVCGAANVRAGMRVPAALVGARLPDGTAIKKARLRGVESSGMLCSARELGFAEESSGLLELPASAATGQDVRQLLQLDDHSIEVDLTPNRGDCLGLAGIAREIGVLNRCSVQEPPIAVVQPAISDAVSVEVMASDACPRYLGRVIRSVDSAAVTPLWMQERLRRSGLRSLGPLVDVTNYVLLELGQPMHAFDLARLQGGITVRWAKLNESMVLLDGTRVTLDEQTLVIADSVQVLALAGIMGGGQSGVTGETGSVFLECAFFSPAAITGRARRYGLQTDSSQRFERGVDPTLQHRAMERATALLLEIAGGKAGPIVERVTNGALPERQPIQLRSERLRRLLGMSLADDEVRDILTRLGMHVVEGPSGWQITPPAFRFDIALEADLIEELARIHGYNRVPSTRSHGQLALHPGSERRLETARIRELLVDRGYQEVVTYSFVDPQLLGILDSVNQPIAVANPISSELSVMRTSLWAGLMKTLLYNQKRQRSDARLFEIGLNFIRHGADLQQDSHIAGLVAGTVWPEQWGSAPQTADFFDTKADLEALLALTGRSDEIRYQADQHPALHPGQGARILAGATALGWIGVLHPDVERRLGLSSSVVLFELNLTAVGERTLPQFQELSKFPSNRRDLAVVVAESVTAQAVSACIHQAAGPLLRELVIFDVYRGPGVEFGRKSMAFGLILQDSSRTLKDEDVDAVINRVTGRLNQELNATLRD